MTAPTKRITNPVVFDNGQPPSAYTQAVAQVHGVAYILGEILDSQYVPTVSPAAYAQRTSAYLAAFPNVDLWEVGNEINGNWLGPTLDVVSKMTSAFDLVKAAAGRTELTLCGCTDSGQANDMVTWVKASRRTHLRAC